MTFEVAIARSLMSVAAALAPESRAEWSAAMRREFDAVQEGPAALNWAVGCLGTALGWRMRNEAPYLLALAALVLIGGWAGAQIFFFLVARLSANGSWMPAMVLAENVLRGAICFGVAAAWPRRAVFTGLCVPLAWNLGTMPRFLMMILDRALADPWSAANNPAIPTIAFPFLFLFQQMWACLLGAALGWGLARLWRIRRRRSAAG